MQVSREKKGISQHFLVTTAKLRLQIFPLIFALKFVHNFLCLCILNQYY